MIYTTRRYITKKEGKIEEEIIGREFNGYIELLSGNCIPTLTSCIRSALVMEYLKEVEPKSKKLANGRLSYVAMDIILSQNKIYSGKHYSIPCLRRVSKSF